MPDQIDESESTRPSASNGVSGPAARQSAGGGGFRRFESFRRRKATLNAAVVPAEFPRVVGNRGDGPALYDHQRFATLISEA